MQVHGVTVIADKHVPTWTYIPHDGWRGLLIRRFKIPKRIFKPERKERVFYKVDKIYLCSFETFQKLQQETLARP